MGSVQYDKTGKVKMGHIYNEDDPTSYFSTLSKLDYSIPQAAKPYFDRLITACRESAGRSTLKVVDIGCSYGVNAALLKHGLSLAELYKLYRPGTEGDREALLKRDREIFDDGADDDLEVVGIDQAQKAIDYAVDAGTLDAGIATDLETEEPSAEDRAALEGADMIISTGCFGYVTQKSLERLIKASGKDRPWMAHFVLRMFDFDPAEAMLNRHGYAVEKAEGLIPQRRFASDEERRSVFENLEKLGVDPSGAEENGWYYAELFVARPREDAERLPLAKLLKGIPQKRGN